MLQTLTLFDFTIIRKASNRIFYPSNFYTIFMVTHQKLSLNSEVQMIICAKSPKLNDASEFLKNFSVQRFSGSVCYFAEVGSSFPVCKGSTSVTTSEFRLSERGRVFYWQTSLHYL